LKKSEADAALVRERNRENLEKLPKVQGEIFIFHNQQTKFCLMHPTLLKNGR
jgi:ATP-dependent Clp protease ATP-binding subunit ClpB